MEAQLRVIAEKLKRRFRHVDGEVVDSTVLREATRLGGARVQSFVPVLVENAASRRLADRENREV